MTERPARPTPAADDSAAVGQQLKKLRKERDWSLSQLAEASQVSIGLLSQIERGRSIPSLRTLTKLRVALDVSLGTLVGQREPTVSSSESRFVKRREDRESLVIGDNRLVKEFLSPTKSEHLQVMLMNIPPAGGAGSRAYSYDGEKAGLVLEGGIRLQLGEDVLDLREGDSFQFNSSIPHTFSNNHDVPAKVVWIICRIPVNDHI
ncbi:helix-turn-helix domain-containing protein [Geminicoccaceae bacterium 1502E]|nr:helix-turn-helix domain-containing protein [Geminicoccaceae bacterium 1502E]